ncbi:MAG: hypothetical protein GTO41_03010, partial [Burkholderiales bacterium]|nr:hypothetical protein [Burkholderiales bacterium]
LSQDVAVFLNRAAILSLVLFVLPFFVHCLGLINFIGVLLICLVVVVVEHSLRPNYGYSWRTYLQEGVNLSNPHRTAIGIACSEKNLLPRSVSEFHRVMKLEPPDSYKGTNIASVSAEVSEENRGRVTIVVSRVIKDHSSRKAPVIVAKPGDTLIYDGTCTPAGMKWNISSSLAERYRDRWTRAY